MANLWSSWFLFRFFAITVYAFGQWITTQGHCNYIWQGKHSLHPIICWQVKHWQNCRCSSSSVYQWHSPTGAPASFGLRGPPHSIWSWTGGTNIGSNSAPTVWFFRRCHYSHRQPGGNQSHNKPQKLPRTTTHLPLPQLNVRLSATTLMSANHDSSDLWSQRDTR